MHFEELYALGAIDGEAGDHVCLNGVKRYSKKQPGWKIASRWEVRNSSCGFLKKEVCRCCFVDEN